MIIIYDSLGSCSCLTAFRCFSQLFLFFWMAVFFKPPLLLSGLTSEDDEAVLLLWVALVQTDLLVRAGERAEGWRAGGAGLAPPPVGRPPPQAEAFPKAG